MAFYASKVNDFDRTYGADGEKNISVGSAGECVEFVKKEVGDLQNISARDSW
ncbi:MAG TPA: hypothetical protein VEZ90_03965 [Blastocatellia bacterium]|nr:hypothetical protein [Blastocatellia bacterium]